MAATVTEKKHFIMYLPRTADGGFVRIAAQVPESHQLFVCPFACGRHGALGGEMNGIEGRILLSLYHGSGYCFR